ILQLQKFFLLFSGDSVRRQNLLFHPFHCAVHCVANLHAFATDQTHLLQVNLEVTAFENARWHLAKQQLPMPFRHLLMHLFEQAYGGVIDRADSPHIHQNKTLGPEVRFQLGEELIRGPEKQIALQFTNHALITETAENRAFSLTALRLRRYFIEIAFAPDDRASYLVPNEEQDCHADPNAGGRDQIPAQRNGDHHRDDRKIEAPRFLKQQPENLTVEHSVGDHQKNTPSAAMGIHAIKLPSSNNASNTKAPSMSP